MNALEQQISECCNQMKAVEEELNEHLQILAKDVDQGFTQLRDINQQGMKIANSLMMAGHSVIGSVVGIGFAAFTGIVGAFNAAQAASAHNEALDKLMKQKIKIAKEKFNSINRIHDMALHNERTLYKLLYTELGNRYDEGDLMTNAEVAKDVTNIIQRVADIYKLSKYNLMMVEFLIEEYKAWMNYEQKSEYKRPNPAHVNNAIYDFLFSSSGMSLSLNRVLSRNRSGGKISGGELLFLQDSSITACMVMDRGLDQKGNIKRIGTEPQGIAKELLNDNSSYKKFKASLNEFDSWWLGPTFVILIIVGLSIWFDIKLLDWLSEWWAFFRWLVVIIAGIIEVIIVGVKLDGLSATKERKQQAAYDNAVTEQLEEMGYVEIYEPDLEEKNVAWEGAKGLFKGLLGI